MHLAVVIGVFLFTALATMWYIGGVATEGTAFYALIYALFFIFEGGNPAIANMEIPSAFISAEGLLIALDGARTLQFFGLALIITSFSVLVALVTAYTRGMIIGVAHNSVQNKRTNIIELFRGARQHWLPTFVALLPIAILSSIIVVTSIPALILNIHYTVLGVRTPANAWILVRLFTMVFLAGYVAKTVFADGIIAQGSKRPIRESIAYLLLHWRRGLATLALLIGAAGAVLVLDAFRGVLNARVPMSVGIMMTIVFFAVVALWRLWTTFFVVRLVR